MKRVILVLGAILALPVQAELVHQFRNPSFSGAGFSSHVLTIEQIEKGRRDSIDAQKKADIAAAEAAANNTPLARFMNLFSSQVYAQLATQLSNNLFQNRCAAADGSAIPGCINPSTGVFTLDGNTITWFKTDKEVILTVVDAKGTITKVSVPIASFGF